jgi:hypothetical protein
MCDLYSLHSFSVSVLTGQHPSPPRGTDPFAALTATESHLAMLHGELAALPTSSSLSHIEALKLEHKSDTLPVVPEPMRADLLPAVTQCGDINLDRRLASTESRLVLDSSLGLLPKYSVALSTDLRMPNPRYPDTRLPVTTDIRHGLLNTSPTYHPVTNSHSNMAILEQSRALSTLPLNVSQSYSLISPHSLLSSVNPPPNTLGSPTLLSSSFLYPHSYPSSTTSLPTQQANFYIHTTEGRTLELLGGGGGSSVDVRSRMTLTPPQATSTLQQHLPMDTQQTTTNAGKQKAHLLSGGEVVSRDSLQSVQHSTPGPHQDDSSVWRPY